MQEHAEDRGGCCVWGNRHVQRTLVMGVQVLAGTNGGYGHETAVTHQDLSCLVEMLVQIPAQTRVIVYVSAGVSRVQRGAVGE